jgi:hypothetical protein
MPSMAHSIVKIIARSDGRRRVLIERVEDGLFRFIEQARHDIPLEIPFDGDRERWASLGPYGTIATRRHQPNEKPDLLSRG